MKSGRGGQIYAKIRQIYAKKVQKQAAFNGSKKDVSTLKVVQLVGVSGSILSEIIMHVYEGFDDFCAVFCCF